MTTRTADLSKTAAASARGLTRICCSGDTRMDAPAGVYLDVTQGALAAVRCPSGSGRTITGGNAEPRSVWGRGVEGADAEDGRLVASRRRTTGVEHGHATLHTIGLARAELRAASRSRRSRSRWSPAPSVLRSPRRTPP